MEKNQGKKSFLKICEGKIEKPTMTDKIRTPKEIRTIPNPGQIDQKKLNRNFQRNQRKKKIL